MSGSLAKRLALCVLAIGCTSRPDPDASLLDPETCADCHPTHVAEWAGSMHAYAGDDPVFRAMNAEAIASGAIDEDFCINCHAPVAVRMGEVGDPADIDSIPEHMRGVTCVFCHELDGVSGSHNGQVDWTFDGVFGGGIADPVSNPVHGAEYSRFLDRNAPESSDACGACHDIVLPNGLHLEKTYAEWQDTIFVEGPSRQGCVHCHLPGREGAVASVPEAPTRRIHDHRMPAIDVALIPWPDRDGQRAAIQDLLDRTLTAELCVSGDAGGASIALILENALSGHDFPSGASHDRRVWIELVASRGGTEVLRTGTVPDGIAMVDVPDADRAEIHDIARTESGGLSHTIVDAVSLEERALPATPMPIAPHARTFTWSVFGAIPDRVEVAVHLRPIGLDVMQFHVDTGRLDPALMAEMPTFTLASTELVWEGELGSCVDE